MGNILIERRPPISLSLSMEVKSPLNVRQAAETTTSKMCRQTLASSPFLTNEAKGILASQTLFPGEVGMFADIYEYVVPLLPGLNNQNAVSVGCNRFEEAVPWVRATNGVILGIDVEDKRSDFYASINEARSRGLITDEQADRIGYGFKQFGNAEVEDSYQVSKLGRFGTVFLRHPDVLDTVQYTGISEVSYETINSNIINKVLDAQGISIITTYDTTEMDIYRKLLEPYRKLGVIEFGLTSPGGEMILPPEGIDRYHTTRSVGGDCVIFGFRKVRDATPEEITLANNEAKALYRAAKTQAKER